MAALCYNGILLTTLALCLAYQLMLPVIVRYDFGVIFFAHA